MTDLKSRIYKAIEGYESSKVIAVLSDVLTSVEVNYEIKLEKSMEVEQEMQEQLAEMNENE